MHKRRYLELLDRIAGERDISDLGIHLGELRQAADVIFDEGGAPAEAAVPAEVVEETPSLADIPTGVDTL